MTRIRVRIRATISLALLLGASEPSASQPVGQRTALDERSEVDLQLPRHVRRIDEAILSAKTLHSSGQRDSAARVLRSAWDEAKRRTGIVPDCVYELNAIAGAVLGLGDARQAEGMFQDALGLDRALGHPAPALSVVLLMNFAYCETILDRLLEAEIAFSKASSIADTALRFNDPRTVNILISRANLKIASDHDAEADSLLNAAELRLRAADSLDTLSEVGLLNARAKLFISSEQFDAADSLLRLTISLLRNRQDDLPEECSYTLLNLCSMYLAIGDADRARSVAIEAYGISHSAQGIVTSNALAAIYASVGTLFFRRGEYGLAETFLLDALRLQKAVIRSPSEVLGTTEVQLAAVYADLGRFQRAESLLADAQGNILPSVGSGSTSYLLLLRQRADLHQRRGELKAAAALLDSAASIVDRLRLVSPNVSFGIESSRALIAYRLGNFEEAALHLENAIDRDAKRLSVLLSSSAEQRSLDLLDSFEPLRDYAMSLALEGPSSSANLTKLAFRTAEWQRSELVEVLMRRHSLAVASPFARKLLDTLSYVRSELSEFLLHRDLSLPDSIGLLTADSLGQIANSLEGRLARAMNWKGDPNGLLPDENAQTQVPKDGILVEFVRYNPYLAESSGGIRWHPARYAALCLSRDTEMVTYDVGASVEIDSLVERFRGAIEAKAGAYSRAIGNQLFRRLFGPVMSRIESKPRLILAPDAGLSFLPFAALVASDGQYLARRTTISVVQSAAELGWTRTLNVKASLPAIFAAIDYDSASIGRPHFRTMKLPPSLAGEHFGYLSETKSEGQAVAHTLKGARLFEGAEATERTLKALSSPRILHIATHGRFLGSDRNTILPTARFDTLGGSYRRLDWRDPFGDIRVGIRLAGSNRAAGGVEDGTLTASEIRSLNLFGTRLVVLSACESGLGAYASGLGIQGFRTALVVSGSRSQVLSLWNVDDFATRALMVEFYKRLESGLSVSKALASAQGMFLSGEIGNGKWAEPVYWAAFLPYGAD